MNKDAATLPVVETFHSLQGEGHHSGRSAFFIRLAGCSVGCPWCDTKHSWPANHHPPMAVNDLAAAAASACRNGAAFGQECFVSHQVHPTVQPASRMKKALRPLWCPSP